MNPDEMSQLRLLGNSEESSVLLVTHPQVFGPFVLKVRQELDVERWRTAAEIHHLVRKDARFQGIIEVADQWMALDWIEGVPLRQYIQRESYKSWPEIRAVCEKICEAVAALHKLGVVHKDLKPENIIVQTEGEVAIIDFGAAHYGNRRTKIGEVGPYTEMYASVAQKEGLAPTPAFDVHQLGVMFEELTAHVTVPRHVSVALRNCQSTKPPSLKELQKTLSPPRLKIAKEVSFILVAAMLAVGAFALGRLESTEVAVSPVPEVPMQSEAPVEATNPPPVESKMRPLDPVPESAAQEPVQKKSAPPRVEQKDGLLIPELYK